MAQVRAVGIAHSTAIPPHPVRTTRRRAAFAAYLPRRSRSRQARHDSSLSNAISTNPSQPPIQESDLDLIIRDGRKPTLATDTHP
jgi:hypothetical protein